MVEPDKNTRNLTDADVEAISLALQKRLVNDFYNDLGKGVFAWFWRAVVTGILLVAAYGAAKEFRIL